MNVHSFRLAIAMGAALASAAFAANAPYPRSDRLTGVTFDRATLQRAAEGSDIWSCAWAADGNIYAAWGDGGGFGGTDSRGRVSIGVARISGNPPRWRGRNIWGGYDPLSPQPATIGKGRILALPKQLCLFVSEQGAWNRCRLWKSADFGLTWMDRGWIFPKSHRLFAFPGFIEFGQAQRLSPDGRVYGYSDNDPQRGMDRRLYLFRVKQTEMEDLSAYEYFSGTQEAPAWSRRLKERQPVFCNPAGIGWGTTCVYDAALRRYLLSVSIHEADGDWGLYESEHPWGPWKTVAYGDDFPSWTFRPAEKKRPAYVHSFPAKWISADGKRLWCVFDRGDYWNVARCALKTAEKPGR